MKALIKILVSAATIFYATTSTATLITHNGFELNTETNIVTGNGLEWLQWDLTIGQPIDAAISHYSSAGWRSANTNEMASLLNSFEFGMTFSGLTNATQSITSPWTSSEDSIHNNFISLFGTTFFDCNSCNNDPAIFSQALSVGPEVIGGQTIFRISVRDDFTHPIQKAGHRATLDSLFEETSYSDSRYGIALVRMPPDSAPIPEPATILLFGVGLVGLVGSRNRRKKK